MLGTSALLHEFSVGIIISSFISQLFLMKILKHSEKLKEEYNAHLYTFHLNSTVVNLWPCLCVCHI